MNGSEKIPSHIAIIMDGNGRWAKQKGFARFRGHQEGATSVREITRECAKKNIKQLTLYAFSQENWKRPRREIDLLMKLLKDYLVRERSEIRENDTLGAGRCHQARAQALHAEGSGTASPTAAAQHVYEAGDVFLAGSRVYVFVGKTGLGHEHGVVGLLKEGRLDLAAARDAGVLVFDMASFAADSSDARKYVGLEGTTDATTQQQVNANMQGAYVLDAAKHPTATFVVKQVAKLDKPSQRNLPQYVLTGEFTLHGVTRPIQVVADTEEQGGWLHLRGGFKMLQSQWGIKPFTKAFGAIGVTDELSVWGDLWIANQRQMAVRPATTK